MGKQGYFVLFLLFILLFSACSRQKDFVIKVGDRLVDRNELLEIFKKSSADTPVKKANVITQFIERTILEREAKKEGIFVSKEEIENFMKENGVAEQNRDIALLYLLRQKTAQHISVNLEPSEHEVERISGEISEEVADRIIFYQILLNKEETAYKVIDELKKGIPFEELAKNYSISPEGKRGGLIDYLYVGELPSEILNVLKNMKDGDVSKVVRSPFGFHILKRKEMIKAKKLSKEEKMKIAKELAKKELIGNNYADWFAKKRKEYDVTVKWEEIEKLN